MNHIGFAATKNTAATNNNTATQAASSLGVFANNFSSSSNMLGGNFNTLILGLFIQIIQSLLKNMPNKPCCDQPPKPTDKPLDLSDTQLNKLDKLPSLGKLDRGSEPTITSVIDADGNNKLSVGDKVNLEQVTDQLDANGQAIIKTSTKTLTANDLSIYNSLKAPNQLSDADTERVQAAINQLGAVGANGAPQATGCYYDNDADGKISVGDQVEALLFDGGGAPTPDGSYRVAKKTVDEAFLALYNPPTTSNSLSLSAEQIANINSGDSLEYVNFDPTTDKATDVNKDGKLSAGDTISGSYIHNPADGIVTNWTHTLTEGEASAINGDYGKALDPVLSRPLEIQLTESLGLKTPNYVKAIFDKDGSGDLSSGDVALVSQRHIFEAPGELAPFFPSGPYISLTDEDIAKLDNDQNTSGSIALSADQIANINSNDTFSSFSFDPKTDVITDTDKDGTLSAGDIISGLYMPNFSFDGLSGPTKTWANTLTEGDVNAINGDNGKVLLSSKLESNQEILQRIEQVLGIREAGVVSNEHVKAVFDKNADNQLSAGDIVVLTASFSQGAISGEPLPVLPTQYIELTQEQVDQIKTTTVGQGLI